LLDSLVYYRYDSRKEAALDFELGRLDMLWFDSENDRDLLTGGDYAAQRYYTNSSVMLGFNCRHAHQSDLALSSAVQYLFDKESVVRVILGGAARTNPSLAPPALALESGARGYYFAPAEARELIDGIEDLPDTINLRYNDNDPQLESVAGYIAGQLRQAGLKTSVQKWHAADAARSGLMDLYLFRYDLPVIDYDALFYPIFSDKLAGQTNFLYYIDPRLEQLLQGARRTDDDYVRKDIYAEAERIIMEKPPMVMLYNPIVTVAFRRDLAGFEFDARGYVDLRETYFKRGDQ
jgi:peptide/nickel transport system substrate-binding protein